VVTFRIKGDPGFDVYHLSDRLRENGWIVPAYSLPPDAEDVHLMRVVVRVDLSRRLIDMLLLDLLHAWEQLAEERPPERGTKRADLWTHPEHAAGHSKRRAHQSNEPTPPASPGGAG
jgi:glutamate decarboxylase